LSHPEPVRPPSAGVPGRSSAEIRADSEVHREQLGRSVEALRGRINEPVSYTQLTLPTKLEV
jgi:hypothetical protein